MPGEKICEHHAIQNMENMAKAKMSLEDEIMEKFYGIFYNSKNQLFPLESTDCASKFKGMCW